MANRDDITTKFKVDISDLKRGITDANNQIKLANAQFKAASSGMDNWEKSAEGIRAKLNQLGDVLTAQKSKLKAYQEELERNKKAQEENGKRADELRKKLNELAQQGVSKTSEEYKKYEKELAECEKESAKAEDAADKLKVTILNQQAEVNKTEKDIRNYSNSLDDLEKESNEAEGALGEVTDAAEKSGDGFTVMKGALSDLVANGIRRAIDALKDFVKETINAGMEFEKSMSKVAGLSGATGDELQKMKDTAKDYGRNSYFSATEASDAMGYMALAGWDAEQSVGALPGVLNLAASADMDLAEASDMLTDYLSAFNLEAEDAAYFSDVLAYAQGNANTTAEGLGEAYRNCAANMNAAGQDMETTTALLSMLANQGTKGSRAGTILSAAMRDVSNSMDEGSIRIGDTVIAVQDAEGNFRDMTDILGDVEQATNGMGSAERTAALSSVFTADSIKGVNMILNAGVDEARDFEEQLRGSSFSLESFREVSQESGIDLEAMKKAFDDAGVSSDDFDKALLLAKGDAGLFTEIIGEWTDSGKYADEIMGGLGITTEQLQGAFDNTSGTAEYMSKVMNDNLAGDLKLLSNRFETLQIDIAEKFSGALRDGTKMLDGLLDGLQWIIDNGELIETLILAVAAAVGTFVAYNTAIKIMEGGWMSLSLAQKAVTAAQWLMNAAMNANPISLLIGLILALVAAFVVLWNKSEDFRNFFIGMWDNIKTKVRAIIVAIAEFMGGLWDAIVEKFQAIGQVVGDAIGGTVRAAINGVLSIVEGTINNAVALINGAIGLINKIPGVSIGRLGGVSLPRLERGGVLPAGQMGLLEGNGAEAVVPLDQNKKWIRAVARDMVREFGGTGNSTTNNSQVFNMTVNTPKAPSRYDLYRQTKNLLALARS